MEALNNRHFINFYCSEYCKSLHNRELTRQAGHFPKLRDFKDFVYLIISIDFLFLIVSWVHLKDKLSVKKCQSIDLYVCTIWNRQFLFFADNFIPHPHWKFSSIFACLFQSSFYIHVCINYNRIFLYYCFPVNWSCFETNGVIKLVAAYL